MDEKGIHEPKKSYLFLITLLGVLTIGSFFHFSFGTYSYTASEGDPHVIGADDSYIAYRYGWNLVHFGTLSWNESSFRLTEGFTNPLWVYVSAAWSLLGNKDWVYPGIVFTSVMITAAFIAAISLFVIKNTKSLTGLVGIFILCVSPIVWLHTTSGLESSVFGVGIGILAYLTISADQAKKSDLWLGNILSLFVVLLRSDGFGYIIVLLISLLLSRSKNWRMIATGGAVGFIVLLIWRELNFGQLVPNTEIAKLNFGLAARIIPGIVLFTQSMLNGGIVFLIAGLFGILSMSKPRRLASLVTIGGWSAYYIYIGGDLFIERHLIGVMVLCAALSGYFFTHILQNKRGWILVAFLLTGIFVPFYIRDPRFLYLQPRPQDSWILIGKEMALQRDEYGTVVIFPAGKIPFFAGGNFVDELGLNDPELALVQRPRFVPGHSAGNHELALEIAKQSSSSYSYFDFNLDLTLSNAQDVLLWANNLSPDGGVHHGLTPAQRELIMNAEPFTYTLIFRGK